MYQNMWRKTLKDSKNILELYNNLCNQTSDINEHLPILKKYGEMVSHITEFGVRTGRSTAAFLASTPSVMYSYDIDSKKFNYKLFKRLSCKTDFVFTEGDTLKIEIENTDLLFIDTYHTYTQLRQELSIHKNKVKNYIILHDTETFGEVGIDNKSPGLLKAIEEFLNENSFWKVHEIFENNNGLYVLKKII